MSRREDIDNAIWSDPQFEALTGRATLFYFWSFTNPRCGMAGLYRVSLRAMAESKVPPGALPVVLEELADARFAFYEDEVLWVRTRVKHLRSRSPQMAKSVVSDVRKLSPSHPLRVRFIEEYRNDTWLRTELFRPSGDPIGNLSGNPVNKGDSDTLSIPSPEGPGQGQGQGPLSSTDKNTPSGRKRPSTKTDQTVPPSSLPDVLRPRLAEVMPILLRIYAERGGAEPTIRGVGLAMGRYLNRDHVRVAQELEQWATSGAGSAKPVIDWAKTFATFLDRTPAGAPVLSVVTDATTKRDFSIYDRAAGLGGTG